MEKRELLYSGKAKSVYACDDADALILEFRNDTSAFNGEKLAQLERKGYINNVFNAWIMEKLQAAGIKTHFIKRLSDTESLVRKLDMLPVECVVRNTAAGSLCKRLGIEEGRALDPLVFEFFLKDDKLGDPMINESHIVTFGWANSEDIREMKTRTFEVNTVLKSLFADAGMMLVDHKLEFGIASDGELYLGDEFSPDGCRLWDSETKKKLDKDRFRQGLGGVVEAYEEVACRLGVPF